MALNTGPSTRTRLTDETRERVLAAVEETGYWGNLAARNLAGGSTSVLGVFTYEPVFPHESSDFYYPFLQGIEGEALHHDVDLLLFTSSPSQDSGREGLTSWARRGRLRLADGCILLGRHSHRRDLAELIAHDYPYVFIGRRETDGAEVPYVAAGYEDATFILTRRLVDHGHHRIGLALEFPDHESDQDRRRGYRRALQQEHLEPIELDGTATGAAILQQALERRLTALAITAGRAAELHHAMDDLSLRMPADLSVVRLGDPEKADAGGANGHLDWTGFGVPRQDMGAEAVRMLLRRLRDKRRTDGSRPPTASLQVTLPCHLSDGSTIGPPPTPTTDFHLTMNGLAP
jgi:DNA-binding LacI/PurR family transcriptional regulator